jgi:hypothetical protein
MELETQNANMSELMTEMAERMRRMEIALSKRPDTSIMTGDGLPSSAPREEPATRPSVPVEVTTGKMPKMAPPEPFDGSKENAGVFVTQCKLYLGGRNMEFPTENAKIMWILSFMSKGMAGQWRQTKMEQQAYDLFTPLWTTGEALLVEIYETFGDRDT